MTLKEAIEKAVQEKNAILAGHIADFCWVRLRWNYAKTYEEVKKITGIELPDWDALLYEADWLVGRTGS
jgi:hypothetical protein